MSLPPLFDSLRVPVVAAPLFIISNPDLVIAECKAGIVGSFPSLNARPIEMLDQWLTRITEELDRYNQENPDKPAALSRSTKSSIVPMIVCGRTSSFA